MENAIGADITGSKWRFPFTHTLTRAVLNGASFTTRVRFGQAIDAFIEVYNPEAAPFEWRKESAHQVPLKQHYSYLLAATRFTP